MLDFEFLEKDIFFLKNHAQNEAGRLLPDNSLFHCFLKKLYMKYKQMVCSLVSICFNSP